MQHFHSYQDFQNLYDEYDEDKDKIGSGQFTVFKVTHKQIQKMYANKVICVRNADVKKEIDTLSGLTHKNVIEFKDYFIFVHPGTKKRQCNLIMEYADGGDLNSQIKNQNGQSFKENYILDTMIKICEGVEYCHKQKVIHQDLKPHNILIVKSEPKIADFGISGKVKNTTDHLTVRGFTEPYAAPEIINEEKKRKIRFQGDIWALGCILYELCTLRRAYPDGYSEDLTVNYSGFEIYSSKIQELVKQMLKVSRDFRPPINCVIQNLKEIKEAYTQQNNLSIMQDNLKMDASDEHENLNEIQNQEEAKLVGRGTRQEMNIEINEDYLLPPRTVAEQNTERLVIKMKKKWCYLNLFLGIIILALVVTYVFTSKETASPPREWPLRSYYDYTSHKRHFAEIQSSKLFYYKELKVFQNNRARKGFYVVTNNSGMSLWEAKDINLPLIDSSYRQILQPLTLNESITPGILSSGGIYIVPEFYSRTVKFFDMKQLNNPDEYLVTKSSTMSDCFLQSENITICCGNKTLTQYDLSTREYSEKLFYYNEEGNYKSCWRVQNGNIVIGGEYGALTILDKEGDLLGVNSERVKEKEDIIYYAEVRANIIVSGERSGLVINDISNPQNIIRLHIPDTQYTSTVVALRYREGYFACGGGRGGGTEDETFLFRRIYRLEKDDVKVELIKQKVTKMEATRECFINSLREIQLGSLLFQVYCQINTVCLWNYTEDFEEERITCIENLNEDLVTNFVPLLPTEII